MKKKIKTKIIFFTKTFIWKKITKNFIWKKTILQKLLFEGKKYKNFYLEKNNFTKTFIWEKTILQKLLFGKK